jgi:hypothetical protein
MERGRGPYPSPAFKQQVAANTTTPMLMTVSGEVTASENGVTLGAASVGGRVSDVWLSVGASGKDDSATLSIAADVKINGTSCLTTAPVIAHVSGEASTNKTTKVSGDTGITQRVLDSDNNTLSPGDVLTYDMTLTRTATPTTEMSAVAIAVEFEPV